MFRIEISGGAPGAAHLVHTYEDRGVAERVAKALVSYLARNKLPNHRQGIEVFDGDGRCVWRQISGSSPQYLN